MPKPYYVILTGSKNNAGDFLIKYRAKELFAELRSDRDIVDIDAWKSITDEVLNIVNGAEALILMGGPALQKKMYPNVYALRENLDDIKVPISLMGVGWKSLNGDWSNSREYALSEQTKVLLERIEKDGLLSSVRDYHTLNVMLSNGNVNTLMTGCPATYNTKFFDTKIDNSKATFKRVGFSLGVSFLDSDHLKIQMQDLILELRGYFDDSEFEVVFHHSTKKEFLSTHNATSSHLQGHLKFIDWLNEHGIKYKDISGSAENLIDYYSNCDLHIGYRVHAHIFMNSISKHSILIAEDGRGKALRNVFGGLVVDAFKSISETKFSKGLRRLGFYSGIKVNKGVPKEVLNFLDYEIKNSYPEVSFARQKINQNFQIMSKYLRSLP